MLMIEVLITRTYNIPQQDDAYSSLSILQTLIDGKEVTENLSTLTPALL